MATKRPIRIFDINLEDFLLRHYVTLTKQLQVEAVMPYLIQEKILSIEDKQQILAHTTSQEKAQALLDKLITHHTCTPTLFVDVLRRSGHGHLADVLEGTEHYHWALLVGEPNGKVARTEGYKDMTDAQLEELEGRLRKVYTEEVKRHEGSTSLEGLMGYEMGNTKPRIHVPTSQGIELVYLEQELRAGLLRPFSNSWMIATMKTCHVGTALAADWVKDKKVTSDFTQVYKLQLNKVRKNQKVIDIIFDQLLHDSKYEPSFSKESLWRYMEQTQEKILFVLEGLDRLNPFTSPEILQLIDKKLLPRASVIVTVAKAKSG
ncbi:PREDICTED: uncharacterized protein LOC109478980 [Branchiostoma belcheri]|uniref:Uncharacterized protein LOC109478980 n=1 Tax=Branchiostoma belcheri TaxID=7741 RepID=A0A6P4ZZH9_BRABE|nr:PREDICTED: uncharacterized protein LOC109478980 [Branchiostoma belcheri]